MTLEQAFENIEFNAAIDRHDFIKAFSFLNDYKDRQELFLGLQDEGLNPLFGFTEIPYRFLGWGKHIKHIEIPDSVTKIGESAFSYCSSLTSIVIPDSVTSIGDDAFHWCTSLTSVVIGDSVTSIGNYAFSRCNSLTSVVIPDGVTSIGDWAFASCNSLTSVIIADSVTSIGEGLFYNCSNLNEIQFKGTRKQALTNLKVKNKRWREQSAIEKIICTDGVINLK